MEDTTNNVESLMEVSSNSCRSKDLCQNIDQEQVEQAVSKTLDELRNKCQFVDMEALMSLVVPKVLLELNVLDDLHKSVQGIRDEMQSYIQHSKVLSEDIAEIFLDLHNIYLRLGRHDKRSEQRQKFLKRVKDAETQLRNNKHFIDLEANSSEDLAGTTDNIASNDFLSNMLSLNQQTGYYSTAIKANDDEEGDKSNEMP